MGVANDEKALVMARTEAAMESQMQAIYFDRPTQKQVLERQCRLLRPGGYLFVGHSESVAALEVPLISVFTSVLRRTA